MQLRRTTYMIALAKSLIIAWLRIYRSTTNFTYTELYVHISSLKSIETAETVESACSGRAKDNTSSVFTVASSC